VVKTRQKSPTGVAEGGWPVKDLSRLLTVVPGPASAWVNKWVGLFGQTGVIANPNWQASADLTAANIATFLAIVLYMLLHRAPESSLRRWAKISLVFTLFFIAVCVGAHFFLLRAHPKEIQVGVNDTWQVIYVLMIQIAITTITFATMLFGAPQERPRS
jgi:peptidoglycan biosynthesis protein MviN/MurJ (putative lipid II flippase)